MVFRQLLSAVSTAFIALYTVSASAQVLNIRAQPVPDQDIPDELFLNKPLVTHMYTADPSAHVFNGKLYIYPSHDIETQANNTDDGGHFAMRDYHVFSMTAPGGPVTDHGVALDVVQVPWASKQMWAPDAAEKNGRYYLYFPAKDKQDIFRIGVASSSNPAGPFIAEYQPMAGTYSIDPSVFQDDDQEYYLYLGGIWGGQLQRWTTGQYLQEDIYPADADAALTPLVAKLADDMVSLAEPLRPIELLDERGSPIRVFDTERRFFEAAWVHKYNNIYYLSYSTGDTHNIQYATSKSPYGPFVYRGKILKPVLGWTNHHSVVKFQNKWWLFYHDSSLSGGQTHLRSMKMTELVHDHNGLIKTVDAYFGE